jgi:acetyl esterase/lipase
VEYNTISNSGHETIGIFNTSPVIRYNDIGPSPQAGIVVQGIEAAPQIIGNTITDCENGIIVMSGQPHITGNSIRNNERGILLPTDSEDSVIDKEALLEGNDFLDNWQDIVRRRLQPSSSEETSGKATDPIKGSESTAGVSFPTYENIKYGPYDRNLLDFFKAESETNTPVLICFHGGAYTGGDKSSFRDDTLVRDCLNRGISVVAANYRLVSSHPFPAPMLDGARVVQFVRSKAQEWDVDATRIAATGDSAGASISLWIGLRDDMAEPQSSDHVSQLSTRLTCVVAYEGQTLNDPIMILNYIGGNPEAVHSHLLGFGIKSIEEMNAPEKQKLAYEMSPINFVTEDDPPLYLSHFGGELTETPLPTDTPRIVSIHHPKFGQMMKEEYDKLGLECIFRYKNDGLKTETQIEFLLRNFAMR